MLPNKGASRFAAQSDIGMMALLAGMERPEKQWRELPGSAGLEIITISRPKEGSSPESVIEAALQQNDGRFSQVYRANIDVTPSQSRQHRTLFIPVHSIKRFSVLSLVWIQDQFHKDRVCKRCIIVGGDICKAGFSV